MRRRASLVLAAALLVLVAFPSAYAYSGASTINLRHWEAAFAPAAACGLGVMDQCQNAKLYCEEVYDQSNVRLVLLSSIDNQSVGEFSIYECMEHFADAWDIDVLTHGSAVGDMGVEWFR
jgi:hypothetical protein